MYTFSYDDVVGERLDMARDQERRAFEYAIDLMKSAETAGPSSNEAAHAIVFVFKLWSVLLEDIASHENDLPQDLKAQIISIGIWCLKEIERLRRREITSFAAIISVSEALSEGLR